MTANIARMIDSSSWSTAPAKGLCGTGSAGAWYRVASARSSEKDPEPEEPPLSRESDRFDESDDVVDDGSMKRSSPPPTKKPLASMSAIPSTYTYTKTTSVNLQTLRFAQKQGQELTLLTSWVETMRSRSAGQNGSARALWRPAMSAAMSRLHHTSSIPQQVV